MREIIIEANDAGQRLDRFLKKYLCNASLSAIYKAIRKDVKVNGRRRKEDFILSGGDVLCLYISDSEIDAWSDKKKRPRKVKKQFTLAYEDDNMIVVCKPYGLLVHGDKNEKKDTLTNQVTGYLIETGAYVPKLEKTFVPSPVNRLDRNTTGLVVFGKNAQALRELAALFREEKSERIRRIYYTIVHGKLDKELHLKNKLLKDEIKNKGLILPEKDERGKYIETIVRPVHAKNDYSIVEVELITGRSHQIRAHLASAGHPLVGDTKYGGRKMSERSTQILHAAELIIDGKSIKAQFPEIWEDVQYELFENVILRQGDCNENKR